MTGWIERKFCIVGDDEESRQRKVQLTFASILVVPAGLLWGALYYANGEREAAALPVGYAVLTFLSLLLWYRLRRYELFRRTQQVLIFVLPVVLQYALGGFVGSSFVIVWSFLPVLMAVLFGGAREALGWLLAFVAAVAAAAWLQPRLVVENNLPHGLVLAFFVGNVAAVSAVTFVVLSTFLADRRRLRQLELSYLN